VSGPPVRVGVIGTGALGFHHARLLRHMPGVSFAGIYDKNPARAADVATQLGTVALEGLAALRSAPPDLLLLDMQLPDGSGLELLRALADDPLLATVPVVMVSADVMEDSIGAALQAGARAYIAKPFNFDEVLKQLDAVLALTT